MGRGGEGGEEGGGEGRLIWRRCRGSMDWERGAMRRAKDRVKTVNEGMVLCKGNEKRKKAE